MKKLIITLVAAIMLCSVLIIGASATDYTHLADDLSSLGLIKGTGNGYELDQIPDRAQAVTMLIRIMGEEKNALEANLEHPFRDVPDWAAPYVAYAYEKGYTDGIGGGYYGSYMPCDVETYAVFVIRALGYGEDMEYNSASYSDIILAYDLGIMDFYIEYSDFTRSELITMSFLSLAAKPAGGESCQLEKMLAQGVVPEAVAKPILERFSNYSYLNDKINEQQYTTRQTTVNTEGERYSDEGCQKFSATSLYIFKGTADDFESYNIGEGNTNDDPKEIVQRTFYTDGKLYIDLEEPHCKKYDGESVIWLLGGIEFTLLDDLKYIEDIKIVKSEEQTVYEISVVEQIIVPLFEWILISNSDIKNFTYIYSPYTIRIIFDSQDRISEASKSRVDKINYEYNNGDVNEFTDKYTMHYKVDAYGDDVVIVFPEEIFSWPERVNEWYNDYDDDWEEEEEFEPLGKGSVLSEKAIKNATCSSFPLQCPDYRSISSRLHPPSR